MDRYNDLQKQGFMRSANKSTKLKKQISDKKWAAGLVKAAKARYASYGPDFFAD